MNKSKQRQLEPERIDFDIHIAVHNVEFCGRLGDILHFVKRIYIELCLSHAAASKNFKILSSSLNPCKWYALCDCL